MVLCDEFHDYESQKVFYVAASVRQLKALNIDVANPLQESTPKIVMMAANRWDRQ
ncbi:hypothetical protein Hanom_Chr05g00472191 [Helianthus anomalus]